jgi:hypothetical protein
MEKEFPRFRQCFWRDPFIFANCKSHDFLMIWIFKKFILQFLSNYFYSQLFTRKLVKDTSNFLSF